LGINSNQVVGNRPINDPYEMVNSAQQIRIKAGDTELSSQEGLTFDRGDVTTGVNLTAADTPGVFSNVDLFNFISNRDKMSS